MSLRKLYLVTRRIPRGQPTGAEYGRLHALHVVRGPSHTSSSVQPVFREGTTMNRGRLILGVSCAIALALTGCASSGGKVRVSSAKRCAAHGGTYNATAKSCSYQTTTVSAAQSCQAEGGYYDP